MSAERDKDISRLAGAISDGEKVDWDTEVLKRPDLIAVINELRGVQSVTAHLICLMEEIKDHPGYTEMLKDKGKGF